jgi:hypothetical protein
MSERRRTSLRQTLERDDTAGITGCRDTETSATIYRMKEFYLPSRKHETQWKRAEPWWQAALL